MKKKALCLALGAAMATSVAIADGPVPLTDAQLDNVTAGGILDILANINIEKLVTIDISKFLDVQETVNFTVNGSGFLAFSEADANCTFPTDCKAESLTATDVNLSLFFAGEGLPQVTAISESLSAAPSLNGLVTP